MRPLVFIAAGLVSACSGPPAGPSPLTSGGFIRDDKGRARLYRGFNLSNRNKVPPFLPVRDVGGATEPWPFDTIDRLADRGFNTVRFVMSWEAVEPERGRFDASYLDSVAAWVDGLGERGFAVLLDFHQDVFSRAFHGHGNGAPRFACGEELYASFERTHDHSQPWFVFYASPEVRTCFDRFWANEGGVQDEYAAALETVARRFKGSPHVLGIDLMNEPWHGNADPDTFERDKLRPFYLKMIEALRSADDRLRVFVEPGVYEAASGRPTDLGSIEAPGVVFAPHYYDLAHELGLPYPGPADATAAMNRFASGARAMGGVPLFVGEYGCRADYPECKKLLPDQLSLQDRHMASSAIWEVDPAPNSFSLTRPDGSFSCGFWACAVDLITRPFARAVAGRPTAMSLDPKTGAFSLEWAAEPEAREPTELVAPPQAYPTGFEVDAPGSKVRVEGNVVFVERDRSAASGRATLRRR